MKLGSFETLKKRCDKDGMLYHVLQTADMEKLSNEKIVSVVNDGILVMYALFLTKGFLEATMFRIKWPEHFHQAILVGTIMLLVLKLVLIRFDDLGELLFVFVFTGVFLMARAVSGYTLLGEVMLFMLALQGISFEKIVKVHFATIGLLLVITIVCSQIGVVDNLVYHFSERRDRQSFGVCYPTDFAAFFVWLSFGWIYIRKEKLRIAEIGIIFSAGIWVWYFCDARLSTMILTVSAVALLGMKLRQVYLKRVRRGVHRKVIPERMQNVMALAIPLCAVVIILLSYFYSGESEIQIKMNTILSDRLALGHQAFERYDVQWFGQFVPMVGFGKNTVTQIASSAYFFLDSSFMSILMCYGSLVLLCVVFSFVYSVFRAKKRNDYYLVLIVVLIAMDCMVEHHMMEMWYDPFLFFALSGIRTEEESRGKVQAYNNEVAC